MLTGNQLREMNHYEDFSDPENSPQPNARLIGELEAAHYEERRLACTDHVFILDAVCVCGCGGRQTLCNKGSCESVPNVWMRCHPLS